MTAVEDRLTAIEDALVEVGQRQITMLGRLGGRWTSFDALVEYRAGRDHV